MRSLKIPKPPRIAVLPSPNGSQAKPNRGAKLCQLLAHHFVEGCTVTLSAAPAVLNTLAGELWIGLRGLRRLGAASIEWRKIFRRLVIDHLSAVEGWPRHNLGLQREEASESNEQREHEDVIGAGLEEAVPRKPALHEHVRPEGCRGGAEFERRADDAGK